MRMAPPQPCEEAMRKSRFSEHEMVTILSEPDKTPEPEVEEKH